MNRRPTAPPTACVRGEIAAGVDANLVLDMLAGTVLCHVGLVGESTTPELAGQIAGIVTNGVLHA